MTLFFAILSLILGLYFFRNNIVISVSISVLFFLFLIYKIRNKKILIFAGIFLIGLALPLLPMENNPSNHTYSGLVVEAKENYFLFQSKLEKFYVYEKMNSREIGDYLLIVSEPKEISMVTYESQFSFKDYLLDKGIKRELSSNKISEKFHNPVRLKEYREKFLSNFEQETSFLIDAFLFCNKDYDSQVINAAQNLNLIFLLSMSGIYFHFLIMLFEKIFKLFLKDKYAELISIILFMPYLIFTFPKLGIIRVVVLYIFRYVNKHCLKKKFSSLFIISIVALFFLIIDYHFAYQEAFYIGFSLSLLALVLQPAFSNIKKKYKTFIMPLTFYVFLLPINVQNGSWHMFSLLFQTLLIPFNEIFILISLISFYINIPFNFVLTNLTKVFTFVYTNLQMLDISVSVGDFFNFLMPLYYAFFFVSIYLIESKRYMHIKFSLLPLTTLFVVSLIPIRMYILNAIYFINVGQGDAILIKNKNNIVLIDTGGNKSIDLAQKTLIPFFNKKQINHIDLLITTHNDFDHSGAAQSLMNNFKVNAYKASANDFPCSIGDLTFENLNHYKSNDENDNSLVFNLSFMGKKFLLMGDASINVEKFLIDKKLDINCDILKVGHHGSKTSSSEAFIKTSSPYEAIISVGESNLYGHPDKEVLTILNKYGVSVRRTDIEGTISFVQFTI